MHYKVELLAEAVNDIQIAYDWYEEQKSGLGYSFLDELNICIDKLGHFPLRYSLVNTWIRKIQLNRFPYLVVFEIEENTVYVIAVRHTSRKPKF